MLSAPRPTDNIRAVLYWFTPLRADYATRSASFIIVTKLWLEQASVIIPVISRAKRVAELDYCHNSTQSNGLNLLSPV